MEFGKVAFLIIPPTKTPKVYITNSPLISCHKNLIYIPLFKTSLNVLLLIGHAIKWCFLKKACDLKY